MVCFLPLNWNSILLWEGNRPSDTEWKKWNEKRGMQWVLCSQRGKEHEWTTCVPWFLRNNCPVCCMDGSWSQPLFQLSKMHGVYFTALWRFVHRTLNVCEVVCSESCLLLGLACWLSFWTVKGRNSPRFSLELNIPSFFFFFMCLYFWPKKSAKSFKSWKEKIILSSLRHWHRLSKHNLSLWSPCNLQMS